MPPRIRLRSLAQLTEIHALRSSYICRRCEYATAMASTTPAPTQDQMTHPYPPITRYPSNQPPSHRDPKYRKSQLLRSYVSLLQSTPLMIIFQHNNLKANEWVGIRRELATALQKLDAQTLAQNPESNDNIGKHIKLQTIQTSIFENALRISEYYKPSLNTPQSIGEITGMQSEKDDPALTHALSESAYKSAQQYKNIHPLTPLLSGSIALLTFPNVSPQHVKSALSILAPQAPLYPAPTRRGNPSYYELPVQDGLKKLLLLGARIDGQIFDNEGTRWVGSIDGGITGLRAQLVAMLQGFGAGLANILESPSRSLYFTMEGRRTMLDDESKPKEEEKKE